MFLKCNFLIISGVVNINMQDNSLIFRKACKLTKQKMFCLQEYLNNASNRTNHFG